MEAVNAELAGFAPEYLTEPAKAVYRIYRDTRFSNDKTPYKTHIAANLHKQGADKHAAAGYYFSVGAEEIEIAAGVYMPGPEELLRLRQHISEHFEEFSKLAADKTVTKLVGTLQGEALSRPPKGFSAEDPALEWIKKKQWYYYKTDLDLGVALTPKLYQEPIVGPFTPLRPAAPLVMPSMLRATIGTISGFAVGMLLGLGAVGHAEGDGCWLALRRSSLSDRDEQASLAPGLAFADECEKFFPEVGAFRNEDGVGVAR